MIYRPPEDVTPDGEQFPSQRCVFAGPSHVLGIRSGEQFLWLKEVRHVSLLNVVGDPAAGGQGNHHLPPMLQLANSIEGRELMNRVHHGTDSPYL
jgi:hypothetical protein